VIMMSKQASICCWGLLTTTDFSRN
jgi:hypothetical protein